MRRLAPVVLLLLLVLASAGWTWPVRGPVLQTFSFDPAHPYGAGQHRGIAIGADAGASVLAPAAGVVRFAGTLPDERQDADDRDGGRARRQPDASRLDRRRARRERGRRRGRRHGRPERHARSSTCRMSTSASARRRTSRATSIRSASCPCSPPPRRRPRRCVAPAAPAARRGAATGRAGRARSASCSCCCRRARHGPAACCSTRGPGECERAGGGSGAGGGRGSGARARGAQPATRAAACNSRRPPGPGGLLLEQRPAIVRSARATAAAAAVTHDSGRRAARQSALRTPSQARPSLHAPAAARAAVRTGAPSPVSPPSRPLSVQPVPLAAPRHLSATLLVVVLAALACVGAVGVAAVRMISGPSPTVPGASTDERSEEDPRRAGLALREWAAPHRPRGRLRRAGGRVRALPPVEGRRRADGERDGRARHAGDGLRRPERRLAA